MNTNMYQNNTLDYMLNSNNVLDASYIVHNGVFNINQFNFHVNMCGFTENVRYVLSTYQFSYEELRYARDDPIYSTFISYMC